MKNDSAFSTHPLPKTARSGMWWSPLVFLFAIGLVLLVQPREVSANPTSQVVPSSLQDRVQSLEKQNAELEAQIAEMRDAGSVSCSH